MKKTDLTFIGIDCWTDPFTETPTANYGKTLRLGAIRLNYIQLAIMTLRESLICLLK